MNVENMICILLIIIALLVFVTIVRGVFFCLPIWLPGKGVKLDSLFVTIA